MQSQILFRLQTVIRRILPCIVLAAACEVLRGDDVQDLTWSHVHPDNVLTGEWSTAAYWDFGMVPGFQDADQRAHLTNEVASYTVDIDTTPLKFYALTLRNAREGHTVTLNVNDDLTYGVGNAADTLRFTMQEGSILNVKAGIMNVFWSDRSPGEIDVGEGASFIAHASNATSGGLHGGGLNVQSNALWRTTGGLAIGGGSRVNIEPGGSWQNTGVAFMPRSTFMTGGTVIFTNRGSIVTSADFRFTGGSVNFFQQDGSLTATGNLLLLGVNSAQHGSTLRFRMSGGAVDNRSFLVIGGNSDYGWGGNNNQGRAIALDCVLEIGAGRWDNNQSLIHVGGWYNDHAAMTGFDDVEASYNLIRGSLVQTGGVFHATGAIRVANGPSRGWVTLAGGDFSVTNTAGTGTLRLGTHEGTYEVLAQAPPGLGTLSVSNGWARLDRLVATSAVDTVSHSIVNLHGGTLEIKHAVQSGPWNDFTVGDGTNPARLILGDGCTGEFAAGLTVNGAAALSVGAPDAIGAATIEGDLTLADQARLAWKYTAATQDLAIVTGTVHLPATVQVELDGDGSTPLVIPLLTAAGGFTGRPVFWPAVTINGNPYLAVIEGDTLQLQPPRGTLILVR